MNWAWWVAAGAGLAWLAQRGRMRITFEGGAAAQLAGILPQDLAAVDELSGQVLTKGSTRELGLSFGDMYPQKRRAGWGYLYARTDEEAAAELERAVDVVTRGRLQTFYLDPEAEALRAGAQERIAWLAHELRHRTGVELIYQGVMDLLTPGIAESCAAASPMCYPIGSGGNIITGQSGQDLIARIWRERTAKARAVGLDIVRPCVFIPGHPNGGGPSVELLAELVQENNGAGVVLFTFAKATQSAGLANIAAAVRGRA